jgi:miniconductance mechanosensitive channel
MNKTVANILNILSVLLVLSIIAVILDILIRKIIIQIFKILGTHDIKTLDNYLMESNFPRYVAHFIPVVILWYSIPVLFEKYIKLLSFLDTCLNLYVVFLSILVFRSILRSTRKFFGTKDQYKDKPLQSYVQVLMIVAWSIGVFYIISFLTNFDIKGIATLGVTSAAILVVFKDTILGFVASIQVSVNDIVRIGDWVTFSKFGADGYVTEINLATVLVQNFDNTFTTIPTYSLIADSFQNWRGMQESGGRRIKRSIYIKQNTVKFMTSETLAELKNIQLIAPYIDHREKELIKFNKAIDADQRVPVNGKCQTNLGIFRNYAESYLLENPLINQNIYLMVRHQPPTDKGIPIEVLCFTYDKTWENHERIQADIFDHLIASVPFFGLEIFESVSGGDISQGFSKINTQKR